MKYDEILKRFESMSNPKNVEGMKRFGIRGEKIYGVSIPHLRNMGKEIGKNHELALQLWNSEIHEARLLSGFIDDFKKVDEKQMEEWVKDFDSWDICDQVCSNLFDKTEFAWKKAVEWSKRKEEFVKRAGFVMMATLAVHDKKASDKDFEKFFPIIIRESDDERNFVRKAVNWALRQIGKRNEKLNKRAIDTAKKISKMNSKTAKWIAGDALRELTSKSVQRKLKIKV